MIAEVQTYFAVAPWLVFLPGLAISLAVIGFNLIGYGLIARIESRRT
jgi:peptide/nickel transport system permease protein